MTMLRHLAEAFGIPTTLRQSDVALAPPGRPAPDPERPPYPVHPHVAVPSRERGPTCGTVLGCVPCQLPPGHVPSKHDPAPEPLTRPDDPDWAIRPPEQRLTSEQQRQRQALRPLARQT